jgi:P pilus assembly chaperone PapD
MPRPISALMISTLLLVAAGGSLSAQQNEAPLPTAVGLGDLLVAPTRVILEGRTRSAELTLVNTGSATATYRISFINLRMDHNGQMAEIEEAGEGERFSDHLIRYSPRQVVLEPNVAQTVRLQVRKPADLEAGEYRSHILFRAVPDIDELGGGVEGEAQSDNLTIRLIPVYGISIPVIVRHGETRTSVTLSEADYRHEEGGDQPGELTVRIGREGNQSIYGHVRVRNRRTGEVIGAANGLAVYVPNESRLVTVPLRVSGDRPISGENLEVSFIDAETPEERTLARADFLLP